MAEKVIHHRCQAIAAERRRARLTQKQLGEAVKTARQNVSQIELGNKVPSLNLCLRYAEAMGCSPGVLDPSLAASVPAKRSSRVKRSGK